MASEIRTAFAAEIVGSEAESWVERARDVVRRAGAVDVDAGVAGDGSHRITALFHNVSDSTRAALGLAGPGSAATGPALRIALCTGEDGDDGGDGGAPGPRALALLAHAAPGQILTTASTAVMVGRALPPGAELRDRGSHRLGAGRPPERIYEFRVGTGDGSSREAAASNVEWARRAAVGPITGVDDQLADLVDAWRAALGGRRRTVILSGGDGVGKTTLAAELALRLHGEGALVLYGRWDHDVSAPYQAFREALGVYADRCSTEQLLADLEGWGDTIARLLPDVGARVGGQTDLPPAVVTPVTPLTPQDESARLADAVEAWLRALTARTATLLLLDDLHWAEILSLRLLDRLHLASASMPLLIVVTADEALMQASETQEVLDACLVLAEPDEFVRITLAPR
jgi:Mrp family chromosome partitioning ATPase